MTSENTVWVLTEQVNEYDQYGQYFVSVYSCKPTKEQLLKHVPETLVEHVLAGGGRKSYEAQWFYLKQQVLE